MRKEQLIRICLAMLLASTTLLLSSCKKEPKEKDPKEALVNTRWKTDMDIPGLDIDEKDRKTSGELYFTSPTDAELTMTDGRMKITVPVAYSYDATQKAYPATVKLSNGVNKFIKQFIMKVNWDTNILLIYAQEDGTVLPKPMLGFRLVK
ncbi:hypothetical protein [uncultured Porphyromonas sp.]|jgi:hypothetical protein|uniref:hypothetical protein n=1 Tax=uncultured Porphyromonas sp. TaxID=159274 RepID=UPI002639CEFC|nr:hypothetical protein [uncultured Porphyromonas sp.]